MDEANPSAPRPKVPALRNRQTKAAGSNAPPKSQNIERKLAALERLLRIPQPSIDYPQRLLWNRFHLYAQNEEDGLVFALVMLKRPWAGCFVDIGCGHNGGNSGMLARELLFGGLMVDADPDLIGECARLFGRRDVRVQEAFVTAENVDELIEEAGLSGDIDFLSLDVDGNDIWIWQAITVVTPRVVCVEYNGLFGVDHACAVPYTSVFRRSSEAIPTKLRGRYYGASLKALCTSAARRGYRLVAVEPRGTNAFFLRHDVAEEVPAVDPADAFWMLDKNQQRVVRNGDIVESVRNAQLPLVSFP